MALDNKSFVYEDLESASQNEASIDEPPEALRRIVKWLDDIYENYLVISSLAESQDKVLYVNDGLRLRLGHSQKSLNDSDLTTALFAANDGDEQKDKASHVILDALEQHEHITWQQCSVISANGLRSTFNQPSFSFVSIGTRQSAQVETACIETEHGQKALFVVAFDFTLRQLHLKIGNHILTDEPERVYVSKDEKIPSYVIDGEGWFKQFWDWLVLCATVYVGLAPYNAVFLNDQASESVKASVYAMLLVFWTDIIINARCSYRTSVGRRVVNTKLILKHYALSWLLVDVVSAVPWEIVNQMPIQYSLNTNTVELLKCLRLLRLIKITRFLRDYSQYSSVILMVNMTLYLLLAHWFACVWFAVGSYEWKYGQREWNIGWIYKLSRDAHREFINNRPNKFILTPTNLQWYWSSMYFSLTMLTTVGFGNMAPNTALEKIVSCMAMPIFALMNAVVFGNVTALIQRMYARRFAHDSGGKELRDFDRVHELPRTLRKRLNAHHAHRWQATRGVHVNKVKVLRELPPGLRADVCVHMHSMLLQLRPFRLFNAHNTRMLASKVVQSFCYEGEVLIEHDDELDDVILLVSGELVISQPSTEFRRKCVSGSLLGSVQSVIKSSQSAHSSFIVTVQSAVCELRLLSVQAINQAIHTQPHSALPVLTALENCLTMDLVLADNDQEQAKEPSEEKVVRAHERIMNQQEPTNDSDQELLDLTAELIQVQRHLMELNDKLKSRVTAAASSQFNDQFT